MEFKEYFISNKEGKSNCVIRSLCKLYNEEYDNVFNSLVDIAKELNVESFNDIPVFEEYMKRHNTLLVDKKDIQIKDLELDNGKYIILCYDKKDFYHMVTIIDNVLYDKDNRSLDLYVINIYEVM